MTNTDIQLRLAQISTPDAADVLKKLGLRSVVMQGLTAQVPFTGSAAGCARTLRLLPDREDLEGPVNGPVNRRLYDNLAAGEILVVDAMGSGAAVLGDMMTARLRARGAAGLVVDGAVRDVPVLRERGFPLFARSASPGSYMAVLRPWESDTPIQCGGVLVMPGDWILADSDGVVVIPASVVHALLDQAEARRPADAFSAALLDHGFPLDDAYPLPSYMRPFLPAFLAEGRLPDQDAIARSRQADASTTDHQSAGGTKE